MEQINSVPCGNQCGLFDFMSEEMGVKVLHPGGYDATDKLSSRLHLGKDSKVLDLACGAGSTSTYLARKYGCKVTGIDISEELISAARSSLRGNKDKENITFDLADATDMPYPDNSFDAVIAQAFMVLIDNKQKAVEEIYRVLKPGGFFGSLELSWLKPPTPEAYGELVSKTCSAMIPRMMEVEGWESFFQSAGFARVETDARPMTAGMMQMLRAEGLRNFIHVMFRMMTNGANRKRMMAVQETFGKYNEYIGYGTYCLQK